MTPIGPSHAGLVDRLAELLINCLTGRAKRENPEPDPSGPIHRAAAGPGGCTGAGRTSTPTTTPRPVTFSSSSKSPTRPSSTTRWRSAPLCRRRDSRGMAGGCFGRDGHRCTEPVLLDTPRSRLLRRRRRTRFHSGCRPAPSGRRDFRAAVMRRPLRQRQQDRVAAQLPRGEPAERPRCGADHHRRGRAGITVHPRPDQPPHQAVRRAALAEMLASDYPPSSSTSKATRRRTSRQRLSGFDHLIENARPTRRRWCPTATPSSPRPRLRSVRPGRSGAVAEMIARYQGWGARVSLFMDPIEEQNRAGEGVRGRTASSSTPVRTPILPSITDSTTRTPEPAASPISTPPLRHRARSRRQRRARSGPRQSPWLHRHRGYRRGLDRPRADCRCARVRPLRDGSQVLDAIANGVAPDPAST